MIDWFDFPGHNSVVDDDEVVPYSVWGTLRVDGFHHDPVLDEVDREVRHPRYEVW